MVIKPTYLPTYHASLERFGLGGELRLREMLVVLHGQLLMTRVDGKLPGFLRGMDGQGHFPYLVLQLLCMHIRMINTYMSSLDYLRECEGRGRMYRSYMELVPTYLRTLR